MSETKDLSLLDLPVEILHRIIDYLDTSTILLSVSNVCVYLRAISATYNRYQLNLMSISKRYFHQICIFFEPMNILSLTLSDDNTTPGQIRLFLSLFNIDQFTRLRSLTFFGINDRDLCKALQSDITSILTSLAIHWREAHCPTVESMNLLSPLLHRLNLQKLELKTGSYILEEMLWPIQCTLTHLTLMYVTQKQYCTILRQTPNLKLFMLNHCSLHKMEEKIVTVSDPIDCEQLKSLILIDSRTSITGLTSILSLTPSLTYLKIICSPDPFDTIADGSRWEKFIRMNLPSLHKFEFFFTNIYNVYYNPTDIRTLISRFQTPFWLEEKQWFVTCDYINYLNQIMLYTTPLCNTDFTFECQENKISYNNLPTVINDSMITDHVQTINLTLTKLMAGVAMMKNQTSNDYLFRNVIKLTIDVDQDWSYECIQYLSTIIDLSRVEKLIFNPDFHPEFLHSTMNNIHTLLALTNNLHTLAIHPFSSNDNPIRAEDICAMIPDRIKYLEVTIRDLETMKILLDHHHQHLWSLTLIASSDRSLPWSEFLEELINREKDFVYWESYYSLRIWFN